MKKWIVRVHDNTTGELVAVDFVKTREHARRVKNQYKSTFRLNKVTLGRAIVSSEGAFMANSKVYY
uniref:Phage protein n=1 Tax=Escherichia phage 1-6bf TaxID=3117708 RepID=A0AAU6NU38_9CAUD